MMYLNHQKMLHECLDRPDDLTNDEHDTLLNLAVTANWRAQDRLNIELTWSRLHDRKGTGRYVPAKPVHIANRPDRDTRRAVHDLVVVRKFTQAQASAALNLSPSAIGHHIRKMRREGAVA